MKNKIFTLLLLALVGCGDFDKINTDPDSPTDATPELMATRLIWNIAGPDGAKTMCLDFMRSKYMGWQEGAASEQYNYFGRAGFSYNILTTGQKMVEKAIGTKDEDGYKGLFYFIKAYKLFHQSLKLGDIPYSEALQGEQKVYKPKYDTQKEVMRQVLDDLDTAYDAFEKHKEQNTSFYGDIIYNGNSEKWMKATATLQLKVLINLSIKEGDPDLKVKERFAKIYNEKKLFESNNDNFQLVYANKAGMINPFFHTETKHAGYVLFSSMLVDSLKKYDDYRLFYYASPAKGLLEQGKSPDSWEAFSGVDITLPYTEMGEIGSQELCSQLNKKYTDTEEGEPFAKIRYSDLNFYLAEAALRKWINEDPNQLYLEGIKADLEFEKTYTPNNPIYNYGRVIDDEYITNFLVKPEIQLTGNFESDLDKILTQKYLANFMQVYELDGYMDYRRTGYPQLPLNPKTNQNPIVDKMPVRFMYPTGELNNNSDNVNEAIQRQFNGNDDVNELMWILK